MASVFNIISDPAPDENHTTWTSRKCPNTSEMRSDVDDWTSQNDVAERRKTQNRLHQRAWRRRKKLLWQQETSRSSYDGPGIFIFRISPERGEQSQTRTKAVASDDIQTLPECLSLYAEPLKTARAIDLYKSAYESYSLRAPRPAHLPALIRLNLLHAITRNSHYIGIPSGRLCRDEFISPFNIAGPVGQQNPILSVCPMSLWPTATQHRIPHHPWIDLLPFPQIRDNILLGMEAGTVDDDELSEDLMEFGSGDADLVERPAMIVWGQSAACSSWEINVAFVKKWGHLIRGCPEIIVSTNAWRSKRGEKPLMVRLYAAHERHIEFALHQC